MKGWLIVNGFLHSEKFDEIYHLLIQGAKRHGIQLQKKTSSEVTADAYTFMPEKPDIDFVLFWDKDVYLAKRLENLGLVVWNRAQAIEWCDSKAKTYLRLTEYHIPTIPTILTPLTFEKVGYPSYDFLKDAETRFGYPMVIKEEYGSMGEQVYLANTHEEAIQVIQSCGVKRLLLQPFLKDTKGQDIRVNVVAEKVIASIARKGKPGDFRSNLSLGGVASKIEIDDRMESLAINTCIVMGLMYAGVDIMVDASGQPLISEVNSNPHFKTTLDCTGIDMSDAIMVALKEQLSE